MRNETIKDQVRRLIAGIAPCYEKRPDLIKDDDYCFGFMLELVELAIAEERQRFERICIDHHTKWHGGDVPEPHGPLDCIADIYKQEAPKDEVSE